MRATLISLKEYQDVLIRIAELDRLLSEVPPEIVEMENEWKSIQERITELEKRKEEQEVKQREQSTALAEAKAKAQKFEADLHEVTNNKEYHAVLKEIDMAKKLVHSLEEDINQRAKDLDEIKANADECATLEKDSKDKYDSAMAAHKESLAENAVERDERMLIRDDLASKVPERMMRQFERIASRRNGVGLALCVSAICRACNVRVRQSVVDELRKFKKVITCESCKRILFFADGDE